MRIGAADVGQGAHLILRQIAAETLGLPLEAVALVADDSALSAKRRAPLRRRA